MLEKEKFYRLILIKKKFFFQLILIYFFLTNISSANLQNNLIEKLVEIKTLSFEFKQKISDEIEVGNCFIKYPLLMKCNYENKKQKTIISNGKTVAIIKKKYKKIYYYPIKSTPLFFILQKEKILNLIKNNKPTNINTGLIEFRFVDSKSNIIKIFFDENSLELKGWETKDSYSNDVKFIIKNTKINNQILDNFFNIPKENDL